jgi:hypothetical protein
MVGRIEKRYKFSRKGQKYLKNTDLVLRKRTNNSILK